MNDSDIEKLISKKIEFTEIFTKMLDNFRTYLAANNAIDEEELSAAYSTLEGFKFINNALKNNFRSDKKISSLLNEEIAFLSRIDQELSKMWGIQKKGSLILLPGHLAEINSLFSGFIKKAGQSTKLINNFIKQ